MQAIEFSTILESTGTIQLPLKVIKELKPGRDLKVIILYNDNETEDWAKLSTQELFNGYSDSDNIYDNM